MLRPRIAAFVTTFVSLFALTALLGCQSTPMASTAEAGKEPVKVEGDVQRPTPLHQVPPVYPAQERADHVEGEVVMRAVIDEKGRVKNVGVEKSSGNGNLDRAALDALSQWTFRPATLHGEPVAVYYHVTLNFAVQ